MQITTGAHTFDTHNILEIHEFPARKPATRKLWVHVGNYSREEVRQVPGSERSVLIALRTGLPVSVEGEAEVQRVLSLIRTAGAAFSLTAG